MTPQTTGHVRRRWPALTATRSMVMGFLVLVVLPLLLLMLSVLYRSGLLDFTGGPLTDAQFKSVIAFLGVALGAAATILGAIFTKATADRTLALERESQERQKLETAVQVLNLIKHEDGYAGKAVTGGALTTLVHLGHPVIAMRTLQAALRQDAVEIPTAVWLIDQVLSVTRSVDSRDDLVASKQDAADLLLSRVDQLTEDGSEGDGSEGMFEWPSCVLGRWPAGLTSQCASSLLMALLELLTSRDAAFWTANDRNWSWVIYTIDQLVQDESTDVLLRRTAASYGLMLLEAHQGQHVEGFNRYVATDEVSERMMRVSQDAPIHKNMAAVLGRWIEEARRPR
jgi:hypothetical protein